MKKLLKNPNFYIIVSLILYSIIHLLKKKLGTIEEIFLLSIVGILLIISIVLNSTRKKQKKSRKE